MDRRGEQVIAWARSRLDETDWSVETIGSDASKRRYFRLCSGDQSFIVMDAPPAHESIEPFINIQSRLLRAGLHVPQILDFDTDAGWMLLSDLGRATYLTQLRDCRAPQPLFDQAIAALIQMQTHADTLGLKPYDSAKLYEELDLFPTWFLTHHWQVEPTDEELETWDHISALLIRWAHDQPQVFCHRDFMPRNLMACESSPGVIDFQDACQGPISYDVVSLFLDAFITWPRPWVDQQLETYRQQAMASGLAVPSTPEAWLETCDFMSVQRHLKVIGIFARIAYRDHKAGYVEDTDRFFGYLHDTIQRRVMLEPLGSLLDRWRARATPPERGSS